MACDEAARLRMQEALYEKAKRQFSVEATVARQREIYEKILRLTARRQQGRDGVLICGAYGRGNAGDDAILQAILDQLKRHVDPDIPIDVLSHGGQSRPSCATGSARCHIFNFVRISANYAKSKAVSSPEAGP